MNDPTAILKDAAYITVGAAVIGFQKAQVQRQEIKKQLEAQVTEARGGFDRLSTTVEERLKLVEERLEGVQGQFENQFEALQGQVDKVVASLESYVEDFEGRLPEQARDFVAQARTAAKDAQVQLRSLVSA
jgi:HPt (histidine-containing phosphotransfer) domain-containing protein